VRGPPPKDDPPARLFRSLLALRPERPIACRIQGAEDVALRVRALSGRERAAIEDGAAMGPAMLRDKAFLRGLVAAALWTHDGPAFSSPDAAGMLSEAELLTLGNHVGDALAVCSPSYAAPVSDVRDWERVLEEGARGNLHEAVVLFGCVDGGYSAVIPRPDRYWGVPIGDLLDGHWMVFRAARAAVEKLRKKA
jgi:hypothetical protein